MCRPTFLQNCGQAFAGCRPYVMNDDVVRTGPKWQAGAGPVRTVSRTVRMNSDVSLGTLYLVKSDCTSNELPHVVIAESPSHGSATVANREQPMVIAANGPMAACNGKSVPTVTITYKPEPGYSGTDGLVLNQTDPNGRRQVIRVELKSCDTDGCLPGVWPQCQSSINTRVCCGSSAIGCAAPKPMAASSNLSFEADRSLAARIRQAEPRLPTLPQPAFPGRSYP